jgi:hypothetical protein
MTTLMLSVLLSPVLAQGAEDEYKELQWPRDFECAIPAMHAVAARAIPAVKGPRAEQFPEMAALANDILASQEAYGSAYESYIQVVKLSHGNCPRDDDFVKLMDLHKDALDKRKQEMTRPFPEGMIEYVSSVDFKKGENAKREKSDVFGLRTACRRPGPPPKLKTPVIPAPSKVLEELRKDTAAFYQALLGIHAAQLRLMDVGQAYNCREIHETYHRMVWRLYESFYARRQADLAGIADASVDWELQP